MDTLTKFSPDFNGAVSAHSKPTLADLMRRKGSAWAAAAIVRRHRIHPRHAALFVSMLGVDRESGR